MRAALAAVALGALAACAGPQSALSPGGEDAARVLVLTEVLFIGAGAIFALVAAATAIALWGPEGWRRWFAGEGAIRFWGLAFPAATLSLLLGWSVWLMREPGPGAGPAALAIEVTGERWWWRVRYADGQGGHLGEANELRLPVGREVELVLRSADVIHSFWVPSLGGKLDMVPGRTHKLRVKAERPGVYRGQCAEYCGGPHAQMAFEALAMAPDSFEAWLRSPVIPPETDAARRGGALFLAAGCGSCHAVRGTPAQGLVGPDLTRLGARSHIAAGALANNPDNLKAFIAANQSVKPGNRMPEFKIFTTAELDDLAAYLSGLR